MDRRTAICSTLAAAFIPVTGLSAGSRQATAYLRTNWSQDPFSLGSYSFFAKGSRQRDAAQLGKPVGDRLFFAGEATHPSYNSTVHAAFESGQMAAAAAAKTDAKSICVLGAGISGLSAARDLIAAGRDVTILEARDRIGGRIWTDTSMGAALDLGASWIHGPNGNPITALAKANGVATQPTGVDYIVRGGDGRRVATAEEPDWLEEYTEIQQGLGAASSEINLRAYWHDRDYGGIDEVFPGGYGQILPAVQAGANVALGWQAKRIVVEPSEVRVENTTGQARSFDAVVVTIPLGVLKSGQITFEPALPKAKQNAIARLGFGLLDKVYLRFDDVFWDDETWIITPEAGLPRGQFLQWLNMAPIVGEPIIMAFNGADAAHDLAKENDQEVLNRAHQALNRAYP